MTRKAHEPAGRRPRRLRKSEPAEALPLSSPMAADRDDMLASYGRLLKLWRASMLDLPFAWATAIDMFSTRYVTQCADYWERQSRCRTWSECLSEHSCFLEKIAQTSTGEAHAFERDVDLVFEQALA